MTKQKILMENTEVPPQRTAAEIIGRLVEAGACNIMQDFDDGEIVGVCFTLKVRDQVFAYKLPVQIDGVFRLIQARRKGFGHAKQVDRDWAKARRVAWRQVLRWVEAQLAMIQLKMVEADEVFLPYMQAATGESMYELFVQRGPKCLPAPGEA